MKPAHLSWSKYIELGVGGRLTRLGERLGANWLIYNPIQFKYYHELAARNAPGVVDALRQTFPWAHRLADVGAGSGAYAAEVRRRGCSVIAFEHSPFGRIVARLQGVDCRHIDFADGLPASVRRRIDLAYCLEVAEHLPGRLGDRLAAFLTALAPLIVFTAAPPGQGGTGHINEQPRDYWIDRFLRRRFEFDAATTQILATRLTSSIEDAWWLPGNAMVFRSDSERS
jgi:hypothetical protein